VHGELVGAGIFAVSRLTAGPLYRTAEPKKKLITAIPRLRAKPVITNNHPRMRWVLVVPFMSGAK
jgi:hypothetical protein